ncbi:hypothetical protein DVH24_021510 [Malus domestica]|uniref:Uncharacterized protein n=1 Tax=Malus domestica TaxID=3750 RepID=A0A498JV07_MALDO|nr:hypothetical protein DVH24_021510 [Malus domestica]
MGDPLGSSRKQNREDVVGAQSGQNRATTELSQRCDGDPGRDVTIICCLEFELFYAMLRGCRTSKHNQIIQEGHFVVCDKPSFENQNKRQKILDNVCSNRINTVQTSDNVITFDNSNQISKGQANFQKNRKGNVVEYVDLGDKNYKCIYCGALFWLKESLKDINPI